MVVIEPERTQMLYNHRTDWDSLREYVDEAINLKVKLKTAEDIDQALKHFTNLVQEACWRMTPVLDSSRYNTNLPLYIKDKIIEKRRLRRIWHLSRHPIDKAALNKAIQNLRKLIQTANDLTLQDQLQSLSATKVTDYSLWKCMKSYDRPQEQKPPLKNEKCSSKWARTTTFC
ncbi:unnamed protein product [Leptosia nina]|uniref:Uncharacterized protein n=1 Tax=Leptosia nina TaxID=320188 RepID=A0AAV1J5S1_9NEOP